MFSSNGLEPLSSLHSDLRGMLPFFTPRRKHIFITTNIQHFYLTKKINLKLSTKKRCIFASVIGL